MLENEREGGESSSETQGDEAAKATSAAAAESESGAESGEGQESAQEKADRLRDEHIAGIAAAAAGRAVTEALERIEAGKKISAGQPPTPSADIDPRLIAEGQAIQTERERLTRKFAAEGYTAENVVARAELAERTARYVGEVTLYGQEMGEKERAKERRTSAIEKAGTEEAWTKFAAAHPNVDTTILRRAFRDQQREEAEAAAAKKGKRPATEGDGERRSVNVSGASEVTASERKARTVTREQFQSQKAKLEAAGDLDGKAKLDREYRNGTLIVKG